MEQITAIFLGPQGSGKGTQVQLFEQYLRAADSAGALVHFEMGKNLRELARTSGYAGRLAGEILSKGELIPYAVSTAVFTDYLLEHIQSGNEHLVIDGFPRTIDQVLSLDSAFQFFGRAAPAVIYIRISDEEATARLLKRGRADDTEAGIRERLRWSNEQTAPIHRWFKENERYRFIEINGEQPVEQVHRDVLAALNLS